MFMVAVPGRSQVTSILPGLHDQCLEFKMDLTKYGWGKPISGHRPGPS